MNDTAFYQQLQTANKNLPRRGLGKVRTVTLNRRDRLNGTLSYPARRPRTSPSISIPSKTPRRLASKSIPLRNVYSVRVIHSAAHKALQSQSGSDKLELLPITMAHRHTGLLLTIGAQRRNNQPPLTFSLLSSRYGICPQRPVGSAVYSYSCYY